MIYLTASELLHVAGRAVGGEIGVRDHGLLEFHSLARNHALVDGNKRLALAGTIAFLGLNGRVLTWSNDEAYDVVIAVASGEIDDVVTIADRIRSGTRDR